MTDLRAPSTSSTQAAATISPRLVYRPDVDGLRALAVVAVVLFHAEVPMFAGGYVGVDVFFVISGYLITQRVVAGVEDGRFSFWEFYAKRVRRLLPAAAAATAATLVAGVVLLPPAALRRLAQSVVAAAASVSNVWFWSQSGYWDAEALAKPLLHTWSLAVEEQFYLVWPLLIVGLVTSRRRRAIWPLLGIGAVSLVVTWWTTGANPSAAFYLTPFRVYEFVIGVYEFVIGAVVVWTDRVDWPAGAAAGRLRSGLWVAGMAAIVVPVVTYSDATAFPGVAAAAPSAGAAAVILSRRPAGLDRLVSNRAATHVGLVSYSLYLVHWPLLVFAQAATGGLSTGTVAVVLLLAGVLAEVQYRLVEDRFRWRSSRRAARPWNGRAFRRVAWPALGAAAAVATAGWAVTAADGLPGRYDDAVQDLATLTLDQIQEDRNRIRRELCGPEQPPLCGTGGTDATDVLVIGDSHTPDGLNIVAAAVPDANLLVSSHGGCPPLFDLTGITHSFQQCDEYNRQRFDEIARIADQVDVVVVSSRMDAERVAPTLDTVAWFEEDLGVDVVLLGQGPFYDVDARDVVVGAESLAAADGVLTGATVEEIYRADVQLAEGAARLGAAYIPKLEWMCPGRTCRAFVPGTTDLIVFDRHHLTRPGAAAFGRHARREIRAAVAEDQPPAAGRG